VRRFSVESNRPFVLAAAVPVNACGYRCGRAGDGPGSNSEPIPARTLESSGIWIRVRARSHRSFFILTSSASDISTDQRRTSTGTFTGPAVRPESATATNGTEQSNLTLSHGELRPGKVRRRPERRWRPRRRGTQLAARPVRVTPRLLTNRSIQPCAAKARARSTPARYIGAVRRDI